MLNIPFTKHNLKAVKLIQNGMDVFTKMSLNGIKLDIPYLKQQIELLSNQKIPELYNEICKSDLVKQWKKKYTHDFNLDSNEQMADILYNVMEYKPYKLTKTGEPSTDHESLERVPIPVIKTIGKYKKLNKVVNTYLKNIIAESHKGILHPHYHLHTTKTYRPSSSNICFQNLPKRDKTISPYIRKGFISRFEGGYFGECDFSGAEVTAGQGYHRDSNMRKYLLDSSTDMHRDSIADCLRIDTSLVSKEVRQQAKMGFVFAEFFGSSYKQCAESMWDAFHFEDIKLENEVLVENHLKSEFGTLDEFKKHIKECERILWYERFPEYRKWKEDIWDLYLKQGYIDTLTGFRISGLRTRNQITNAPIQGSSFHCLLSCCIEIQRRFEEMELKSLMLGQIYDSMVFDFHPDELITCLQIIKDVVNNWLPVEQNWLDVPMGFDIEIAPAGKTWYDLEDFQLDDNTGLFVKSEIKVA